MRRVVSVAIFVFFTLGSFAGLAQGMSVAQTEPGAHRRLSVSAKTGVNKAPLQPISRAMKRPTGVDFASDAWQKYFTIQHQLPTPRDQAAYFPTATGTMWTYRVTFGSTDPLFAYTLHWPLGGDNVMTSRVRGRILREEHRGKTAILRLQIAGHAATQGPLRYGKSVEVKVLHDDLEIFHNVEHVYWAIAATEPYGVIMVTTYSPFESNAPMGSWGTPMASADGYTLRQFFFAQDAGVSINLGESGEGNEKDRDDLLFTGYDLDSLAAKTAPCLHFLRLVPAGKTDDEEARVLYRQFTEEYWFEKGRGLVRFVQKIGGTTSMEWALVEYRPGAH